MRVLLVRGMGARKTREGVENAGVESTREHGMEMPPFNATVVFLLRVRVVTMSKMQLLFVLYSVTCKLCRIFR